MNLDIVIVEFRRFKDLGDFNHLIELHTQINNEMSLCLELCELYKQ